MRRANTSRPDEKIVPDADRESAPPAGPRPDGQAATVARPATCFGPRLAAFQQVWDPSDPPPAITVHVVAGLGPGFLVEITAVAAV